MRALIILLLASCHFNLVAQSTRLDSMRALLGTARGKEWVDLANEYAYTLTSYTYKEAQDILAQSFDRAKKLDYKKGMAEALMYQGIIESNIGSDSTALSTFKKSLAICNEADLKTLKGRLLTSMGTMRLDWDELDSASLFLHQAYENLKDSANPLFLSYLYMNLGELSRLQGNSKLQIDYYKKSYRIRKRLPEPHAFVWTTVSIAGYYNEHGNYNEALSYLDTARQRLGADTIGSEEHTIISKQRAIVQSNLGNHKESLSLFAKAKTYYEKNPYSSDYVDLLIEIGYIQADVSNYELSLKYYFQALKLIDENHFERKRSQLYFRISYVYYLMEQNLLSEDFAKKTLAAALARNHKFEQSAALNLFGLLSDRKGDYRNAIDYYEQALAIRRANSFRAGVASTLLNLGIVYEKIGNNSKAEQYDLESLAIEEELGHAIGIGYSYQTLGQLYTKLRNFKKSIEFLDKAEALSKQVQAGNILVDVYRDKRNFYIATSNLQEALNYSLKYESLRDSILGKNVANRVLSLQYDYELDQKESKIKILNQQRQLQQERLEQQQRAIRQQRLIIFSGVLALVILAAGSYVIFGFYKKVSKLNREISERNEEVTAQSEELREANDALGNLNREIKEQKEEIQAQAEELIESNQTVSRVNESLENKINERTHELKEAYRELDTFFYRSSHDFRRPLTTFMGLAEVAKVTLKDPFALELFNKVNETALSLDKMLHKLQSVSLVGSQELIYSEVFLKEIVQVELDQFRDAFKQKNIDVRVAIEPVSDFHSFPALIKIVLQNLIENSIAFCQVTNPWIKIEVRQALNEVVLKVSDNGCGIEEKYIPRVYEMYFRASEKSKGNGLGLYIVKKIVDKLRGKIEVQSIYGEGTSVIVSIPNQQS